MTASPVRFTPDVERAELDEAATVVALEGTLQDILDLTSADYGHAVRAVHAKGHAVLTGQFEVLAVLSPELAQGLFAVPGRYDAVLRLSTIPGDILPDGISGPRGLALKLIGVPGVRLPGSEAARTQDFVMVNGPAFGTPDARHFVGNLKLLAKTTDKAEGLKQVISTTLQLTERLLEAVGLSSGIVKALGGAPNTNPLGETYYSQTPFRYGDYIAKFALVPVSPNLIALSGVHIDTHDRPDALREELNGAMQAAAGAWEFRVQLCTDLGTMPVEDASKVWDEAASPYVTVARLTVPAQTGWAAGVSDTAEDALAFSPWHSLAAHQPLGSVNRARRATYEMSSRFRGKVNGCPMHEPAAVSDVLSG